MRKPLNILITGAAGFIGAALTRYLTNSSGLYNVTAVDNVDFSDPNPVAQLAKLRAASFSSTTFNRLVYDTCDIRIPEDVERVFSYTNFDIVIHLAAKAGIKESLTNPYDYAQTNLIGFTNVIEAARKAKVQHFVYASSSSVYGEDSERPFSEEQAATSPMSFYAATKRSNELMAYSYSSAHGLPTTSLRFFTVYGARSRLDMAPFKFTNAIVNDQPIDVYNYGKNTRDFTHISEVVRFIERAMCQIPPSDNAIPHSLVNVGNGQPFTVMEFINFIETAVGKKAKLNLLPPQVGDMMHTESSVANVGKWGASCFASNNLEISEYTIWRRRRIQEMVNWVKLYQSYNNTPTLATNLLLQ
jgi:UDP-glucuronate 4-epimerase